MPKRRRGNGGRKKSAKSQKTFAVTRKNAVSALKTIINTVPMGLVGLEKKYSDLWLTNKPIDRTITAKPLLWNPDDSQQLATTFKGTGSVDRIGNEITIDSLFIKGWIQRDIGLLAAALDTIRPIAVRLLVVIDTQPNQPDAGDGAAYNLIFDDGGHDAENVDVPFLYRRIDTVKRFKVLHDSLHVIEPDIRPYWNVLTGVPNAYANGVMVPFNIQLRDSIAGTVVSYNASSTGGNENDTITNGVYFYAVGGGGLGNTQALGNPPTIYASARMRFRG